MRCPRCWRRPPRGRRAPSRRASAAVSCASSAASRKWPRSIRLFELWSRSRARSSRRPPAAARAPAAPPRRSRRAGWRAAGSAPSSACMRGQRDRIGAGGARRSPRAGARSRARTRSRRWPPRPPPAAPPTRGMPGALGGVGHAVPQRERVLEVAQRLAGRVDALRVPCPAATDAAERPRQVVRAVPVAGELGLRRRRRVGLHRPRQRRVQRGPLARQQVLVDRLADERVAEGVGPVGVGDEQLVRDGLARAVVHVAGERRSRAARGRSAARRRRRRARPPGRRAGRRSKRPSSASRSVAGSSPVSAEAASSSSV